MIRTKNGVAKVNIAKVVVAFLLIIAQLIPNSFSNTTTKVYASEARTITIGDKTIELTDADLEDPELNKFLKSQGIESPFGEDASDTLILDSREDEEQDDIQNQDYELSISATRYPNKILGCDVSKWQDTIDWTKMKNAGIKFVFIRACYRTQGDGTLCTDPKFESHIQGAIAAGLKVGVYTYSESITTAEAEAEADYILSLVSKYKLSMPIVFDYEDFSAHRLGNAKLTKAQHTQIVTAFCERIKKAGQVPAVYGSASFFVDYMDGATLAKKYMIWAAAYSKEPKDYSYVNYDYDFWQYSDKGDGNIYGVSTQYVDMDYWYTDTGTIEIPAYENYVAKLTDYSISLSGNIGVNMYLQMSSTTLKDTGAYAEITVAGHEPIKKMVKDAQTKTENGITKCLFACDVASTEMTKNISVRIVRSDGKTSDTYNCSVKQYADQIISRAASDSSYQKAASLVKSMLNYGSYAQQYFAYDSAALANANLTDAEKKVSSVTADTLKNYGKTVAGSESKVEYLGSSLILKGTTAVRHYFKVKDGNSISGITCKIDGTTVTPTNKSGVYYIEKSNILSQDLNTYHTATIGGLSIKYCGLSYVKEVVESSASADNLKNVARALYLYNQSARSYLNLSVDQTSTGGSTSGGSSSGGSTSGGSSSGGSTSGGNTSGSTKTTGEDIVAFARQHVGNPYVYGGNSLTEGCDCSGFVHLVYAHFGISTPRQSQAFLNEGTPVSRADIQPGDVVVYPGHVAIYAGNGLIVEALNAQKGITDTRSVDHGTISGIRRYL